MMAPEKSLRIRRGWFRLLAGLTALLAAGCSSFNKEWKAVEGKAPSSSGIEGPWHGTWRSDVNAHTDQLRCLITPSTNGTYSARFQAKYRKWIRLTFSYTVSLTVTNQQDGFQFEGSADLGWLAGGDYTYRGRATPTNFFSSYRSRHDRGVFEMTRPAMAGTGSTSDQR